MGKMRLHKFLAQMGVDSRRKCEKLITDGRVKVNGIIVTKLGSEVDVDKDRIEVDEQVVSKNIPKIYVILNKPKGFLCTHHDPFGRPTIYDLLKKIRYKLNYAGRLDLESEGLVFLTNDGELINHISHPKKEINKVYIVKVKGQVSDNNLKQLKKGIPITPFFTTNPCQVILLKKYRNNSLLKIIISEGKKRQIRKMFAYLGFQILELKRTEIGILKIDDLKPGQYRFLKEKEVKELNNFLENKQDKKGNIVLSNKETGLIITIDGPAAAGKSTIARELALKLGFNYINTGDLYRYVTYRAMAEKLDVNRAQEMNNLSRKIVNKYINETSYHDFVSHLQSITEKIHSPEINEKVSFVARHPSVRKNLIPLQRILIQDGSVVVEGRDIGTVVAPYADLKFFLTADQYTRAMRRFKELRDKEYDITFQEVEKEISSRDHIDSRRKAAPLVKSEDAILINTSNKSIDQVIEEMLKIIKKFYGKNKWK